MWLWYSIALPGKVLPPPVYVNSTYPGKALHPACLKGKKQWELLQTVDHGFRISSQTNARASTILQQLSESALQLPTLRFCRGQSHFSQNSTEMTKWNRGTLSWFPLSLHLRVQLSSCMGCGTYPYEYTIEIIVYIHFRCTDLDTQAEETCVSPLMTRETWSTFLLLCKVPNKALLKCNLMRDKLSG